MVFQSLGRPVARRLALFEKQVDCEAQVNVLEGALAEKTKEQDPPPLFSPLWPARQRIH